MQLDKQPIVLNSEFKAALHEMENGNSCLFITGKAGTGKSTLLEYFRKSTQKKIAVLAPTGIAALHVKGQTIHSFFGIPPRLILSKEIPLRKYKSKLYKSLDILIIDEASMVRADILDHIDYLLKLYRKNQSPFGGLKLILIGDLCQLPPVVTQQERNFFDQTYETAYFFSASCFSEMRDFHIIQLNHIFRQQEKSFIDILDSIRNADLDIDLLQTLNKRWVSEYEAKENEITLTATNASAEQINTRMLNMLSGQSATYLGSISGDFQTSILPVDQLLVLKPGAQIMFVRNDPEYRFVNGSLGKVVSCSQDSLKILIKNQQNIDEEIEVVKDTWELVRYVFDEEKSGELKYEVIGKYEQLPVKLAWAITIHKSQGKTFDQVVIDLGRGAFEFGQTYVALSRCRTLDGIVLKKKIEPKDIMADERIIDFMRQFA
jgi:ATP-dependent DNA helicase PIF1